MTYGGAAYANSAYGSTVTTRDIDRVLIPARTVNVNRNGVGATGTGAGTVATPARTINAERTPTTVMGAGTGTATVPLRVLEVGRTEPTVTGIGLAAEDQEVGGGGTYGGFGYGGAAYGSNQAEVQEQSVLTIPVRTVEAQRESPTFTGAGTVGTELPPRTLEVSRGEINVLFVAGLPRRDLKVSRATPDVTGLGTVTTDLPLRTLEILRQSSGFGFKFWIVDGDTLRTPTSETASDTTLSIVFRVESSTLNDTLRPLKSNQGKAKLLRTDDGGFTVVDRANGGNTFDVLPPVNRLPLRQRSDYHVESYEESLVSQTVDEWDVELELLRTANRTDSPSINESRASDEWAFDTRYGQIATERIDAEFVGRGEGGVRRFEITARLTKEQSHVFEAALNRLDGARIREIPDATNVAVDDTDDDAATLGVTTPVSDTIVSDGDYVVIEPYNSRRLNDGFQEIEFVVAET